jgi:23S rRNA (guanosine2251-2'-O)-methyltransferase
MPRPARQFYLVAHNIRSLHNVGSIFRTADSLGVSKIYLTGYTGAPPDPKIAKVALGAENFVTWEKVSSVIRLIKKLRSADPKLRIAALENNISRRTINLAKYNPRFPLALILGEETQGLNKTVLNLVDDIVEIPMRGHKESLNVSVAAGVAAYQILNKK